MTLTLSGCSLKHSANSTNRPSIFPAQFSLSHCCWLITYPIAGQSGARFKMTAAFAVLAAVAVIGSVIAWKVWPVHDPDAIAHSHSDTAAFAAQLEQGDE